VLEASGTAMDAVEAAIVIMGDDETFDARRGSFLNADGQVELDAGCMDGAELQVGAVASVQFIRNPIRLARAVPVVERGVADTVGCVALDQAGHLAAGTSTGGTPNKMPGRVGDVPMVGCGFYAHDELGSASCTGWGESIAKVLLARPALHQVQELGDPQAAARAAIQVLTERVNGLGGVILLAADGRPGWYHNTPRMALAYRAAGMDGPEVKL
jgi:beta-aspartyl-peptidase (threonine type)